MDKQTDNKTSWSEAIKHWKHPRVITMLLLGFSAGLPILLIFSSLSLWLREAGVSKSAVTFFAWAALGYSFKFVWAPLVDTLPIPFLTKRMGRRRSWLFIAQFAVITAICLMAFTNPALGEKSLVIMALSAVLLGFSSATQDIVIDAYRIECAEKKMQAILSSVYIAGYRIGMLVAGAGALYLADWFGTSKEAYNYTAWQYSYLIMAAVMLIGVLTTIFSPEPDNYRETPDYNTNQYFRFLLVFICTAGVFVLTFFYSGQITTELKASTDSHLIKFLIEAGRLFLAIAVALAAAWSLVLCRLADKKMVTHTYIDPVKDFFRRYGLLSACLLLSLISVYRLSDIVLGVVANIFYQDMGFSKTDIATITKTFGLFMTLAGGFIGGIMAVRYGIMKTLFLGAVLSSLTNLLFLLLAKAGTNTILFTLVIAADNLSAGIATTAFVAFLSSLTNISFTAMQYAIFSSIMTLFPKLLGGYSGTIVEAWGYESFFLFTTILGIPVLILIWLANKYLVKQE